VPPQSSIDQAGFVALAPRPSNDADLVAVFLAEQRHRAGFHRRVRRHQPRGDLGVFADAAFTTASTRVSSSCGDRARLADVEAQPVRARSGCPSAPHACRVPAQRLVQQVRRRVVRADRGAAGVIHGRRRPACRPRATPASTRPRCTNRSPKFLLRVGNPDAQPSAPAIIPVSPTWPPLSP
jgi:hypothetical protein